MLAAEVVETLAVEEEIFVELRRAGAAFADGLGAGRGVGRA